MQRLKKMTKMPSNQSEIARSQNSREDLVIDADQDEKKEKMVGSSELIAKPSIRNSLR